MSTKYEADITTYSDKIPGEHGNYGWSVRFDNTGPADYIHEPGYIGIIQYDEHGNLKERVLLSPDQMEALIKFRYKLRKVQP